MLDIGEFDNRAGCSSSAPADGGGLIDAARRPHCRGPQPGRPRSVPSSALADMLRTSPNAALHHLLVIPFRCGAGGTDSLVPALSPPKRTAWSWMRWCWPGVAVPKTLPSSTMRSSAGTPQFPRPAVTGIGHDDDLTVADLVADHRAATPTAAMVACCRIATICRGICSSDGSVYSTTNAGGWNGNSSDSAIAQNCCSCTTPLSPSRLRQTLEQSRPCLMPSSERWLERVCDRAGRVRPDRGQQPGAQPGDRLTRFDGSVDTRVETKPILSSSQCLSPASNNRSALTGRQAQL